MRANLTRRQLWRRQCCRNNNNISAGIESPLELGESDNFDEPTVNQTIDEEQPVDTSLVENSRIYPSCSPQPIKKRVTFDYKVRVIQIPTIDMFERLGLADMIWWKESEFDAFKEEAVNELRIYMINSKILDSKVAIQKLYINEVPVTLKDLATNSLSSDLSTVSFPSPATSCDTVNSDVVGFQEGHEEHQSIYPVVTVH